MENMEKTFIISFGNSSKYKMRYDGSAEELADSHRMKDIKSRLVDYIKDKVAFGSYAERYATPEIKEIYPDEEKKYEGYPTLDEDAISDIKRHLLREVENMKSQKELSKNAPFGDDGMKI